MSPPQHLILFKVTGKVQNVGFRASTMQQAQSLGLRGWCHNNPDSSVEGVAIGSTEAIHDFKAYLKRGPPSARVSKVEYMKDMQGASEEEIKQALRGCGSKFDVRNYEKL